MGGTKLAYSSILGQNGMLSTLSLALYLTRRYIKPGFITIHTSCSSFAHFLIHVWPFLGTWKIIWGFLDRACVSGCLFIHLPYHKTQTPLRGLRPRTPNLFSLITTPRGAYGKNQMCNFNVNWGCRCNTIFPKINTRSISTACGRWAYKRICNPVVLQNVTIWEELTSKDLPPPPSWLGYSSSLHVHEWDRSG